MEVFSLFLSLGYGADKHHNIEKQKTSLNSRQSAETYEFEFFRKIFQEPVQNWENSRSVRSAPEISLDAPIKIESESK